MVAATTRGVSTGVAGAYAGARLTHLVAGGTLMTVFAALMLVMSGITAVFDVRSLWARASALR